MGQDRTRDDTAAIERRFRGIYLDVPWVLLNIDRTYQREQSDHKIKDIATLFDPDAFGWLVVGRRHDGTYWVIDGGHRYLALQLMGYTDQNVPCMVLQNTTPEQEAKLYDIYNAKRGMPRITDRFKAQLRYGDPKAVAINGILNDAGYEVCYRRGKAPKNEIGALREVIGVYDHGRAGDLTIVLAILRAAWGDEPAAVTGTMIAATHKFLVTHRDQFEATELVRKLKTTTPAALMARATQIVEADGGAKYIALYRAIRKTYNHNRRNGVLPDMMEVA